MAEKRRYTVTVPDHVGAAIEARAKPLSSTPTEYAADVLRWWFGQGCPPVTHDETALRATEIAARIKPLPENLDVWNLDPNAPCVIDDDKIVTKLLTQLGIPNLFARAAEHDQARFMVVFDNHPTHYLQFDLFKGSDSIKGDGMLFNAYPKSSYTREAMLNVMREQAREMGAPEPRGFSQIPVVDGKSGKAAKHAVTS